jgi:hypothetical protein
MRLAPEVKAALEVARDRIVDAHLHDDPNVVAVGLGRRRRDGEWVDEPVVTVLVTKKRAEALVSRRRLLPRSVEVDGTSWGVDVLEGGPPPVLFGTAGAARPAGVATAAEPVKERMRPPRPGCSISNAVDEPGPGTYGANVRGLSDGRVYLLSCNHVLARNNQGQPGEDILQPGVPDGPNDPAANAIATLTRFDPIDPVAGTETDCAIARLDRQDPVTGWTDRMARDLMGPIDTDHPAVGMVVGGNFVGHSYLTWIDTVLDRLGVELTAAIAGDSATKEPEVGMKLEKVGQASGYSSSEVVATNMTTTFDVPGIGERVPYRDLVYVMSFSLPGDSGAIACEGGDGKTFVEPDVHPPCPVLGTVGAYYELPLAGDEGLSDQLRDDFMAQSQVGNLLISATYVNAQVVIDRLEGQQGSGFEVSYAQEYYDLYRDFVASVLADPTSTAVVTQQHLDDAGFMIWGLGQTVLTADEANACFALYDQVLTPTLGMTRQQLVDHMNRTEVTQAVYAILAAVPTLELHETIVLGS